MSRLNYGLLGASVNEFIQIWALGGDSTLNLTNSVGCIKFAFNCTLVKPGAPHSLPPSSAPCPLTTTSPHRPRQRGPAQREKKCQPATSSTASVASTTVVSSTPSTTSGNYKGSESSGGESLPNFKCHQWDSDILKVDFFARSKLLF